jgi:hypothetical protein
MPGLAPATLQALIDDWWTNAGEIQHVAMRLGSLLGKKEDPGTLLRYRQGKRAAAGAPKSE